MTFSIKTLTATTAAALCATAVMAANPTVGGAEMSDQKTIVENAAAASNLSTLVAAVQAADLADDLMGAGPFTVFAPTNAAFDALPAGTVETLLRPENKPTLEKILLCHVVPNDVISDQILKNDENKTGQYLFETVGGCTLTVQKDDAGIITVGNDSILKATVETADVMQSNGVVHVIDTVLVPAS